MAQLSECVCLCVMPVCVGKGALQSRTLWLNVGALFRAGAEEAEGPR